MENMCRKWDLLWMRKYFLVLFMFLEKMILLSKEELVQKQKNVIIQTK